MYPRRKAKPSCLVQKAVARPQDTKLTERYFCFFCPRHIGRRFRLGPCKKTCPPLATLSVLSSSGFVFWVEQESGRSWADRYVEACQPSHRRGRRAYP